MGAPTLYSSRLGSLPNDDLLSASSRTTPKTLTVKGAAEYSGLSTDKIRKLVNSRRVAVLDRGANGKGNIHVLTASLDAWLDAQTVEPLAPPVNERPATHDADDDIPFDGQPLFS